MRQMVLIRAETPEKFVEACNEEYAALSRSEIVREEFISSTAMYIIYSTDDSVPEPEELKPEWCGRRCAECWNYDWGKKCLAGKGHVKPMTEACEMFNDQRPEGGMEQ